MFADCLVAVRASFSEFKWDHLLFNEQILFAYHFHLHFIRLSFMYWAHSPLSIWIFRSKFLLKKKLIPSRKKPASINRTVKVTLLKKISPIEDRKKCGVSTMEMKTKTPISYKFKVLIWKESRRNSVRMK